MKSRRTRRFHECFARLPSDIQSQARRAYQPFRDDPGHPELRFKNVHETEPTYSVRVSQGYRAAGVRKDDAIIWFWIGSHSDYDRLLLRLKLASGFPQA